MSSINTSMPVSTPAIRFGARHSVTDLAAVRSAVEDTFGEDAAKNVTANTIKAAPKGVLGMLRSVAASLVTSRVNGGFSQYSVTRFDSAEERDKAWQNKLDTWGGPNIQVREKTDDRYVFGDRSLGVDFVVSLAKQGDDSIVLINQASRR